MALLACSGEPVEPALEITPPIAEGRYGLVLLHHVRGEPGVAVSGQFFHYRGHERSDALHALALPEQAWLVAGQPEAGACRRVAAPETLEEGQIDLLGTGTLRVSMRAPGSDATLSLEPRDLPRVLFSMSGVVYDADAPEVLPYRTGEIYRVRSSGGEVGPLRGEVQAPTPVRISGHVSDEAGGLWIEWEGEGPAVLTIARQIGGTTVGVQCAAGASGELHVPALALAFVGDGEAQISISSVSGAILQAPGLEAAHVVFVSSDAVNVWLPDPANVTLGQ